MFSSFGVLGGLRGLWGLRGLRGLRGLCFQDTPVHPNRTVSLSEFSFFNENVNKQSHNTHFEVTIFARQKSKAQRRVWIVPVQKNLHIAETVVT